MLLLPYIDLAGAFGRGWIVKFHAGIISSAESASSAWSKIADIVNEFNLLIVIRMNVPYHLAAAAPGPGQQHPPVSVNS